MSKKYPEISELLEKVGDDELRFNIRFANHEACWEVFLRCEKIKRSYVYRNLSRTEEWKRAGHQGYSTPSEAINGVLFYFSVLFLKWSNQLLETASLVKLIRETPQSWLDYLDLKEQGE